MRSSRPPRLHPQHRGAAPRRVAPRIRSPAADGYWGRQHRPAAAPARCSPRSASRRGARPALGAAALPISNRKLIKSSSRGAEAARESCPRRSAEEAAGAAAAWKLKREEGKNTLRPRQRPTGQENNAVTERGERRRLWGSARRRQHAGSPRGAGTRCSGARLREDKRQNPAGQVRGLCKTQISL